MIAGFTLDERAALVALSPREFIALGHRDPRIIATPTLEESGWQRVRAWVKAGMPEPDLSRLGYIGDEVIGRAVAETVAMMPAPVAWHCVEVVSFAGVGVSAIGLASNRFPMPKPPKHDRCRLVLLATDSISVCAHEIAHTFQLPPLPPIEGEQPPPISGEVSGIRDHCKEVVDQGEDALILYARQVAALERHADRCASVWTGKTVRLGDDHIARNARRVAAGANPEKTDARDKHPLAAAPR